MAEMNYTVDLSKPSVVIGGAPGVPGKTIGGLTQGEAVRLEADQDRVTILKGLKASSFKVMPLEGISHILTVNVTEASKSILFMDALYKAGVPFSVIYRDGETTQAGIGMVLGDPPKSISTDPAPRVYRIGCINMTGPSGAAATTESGADLES